jgi:hypothetical protein
MKFKIPLMLRILGALFALFLISYNVFYKTYKQSKNKKTFYEKRISSKVFKSNVYEGRSVEFHLENGLKVYFMPPVENKLLIGDSVRKKPNSYIYDVYRKGEDGIYRRWATYNSERVQ